MKKNILRRRRVVMATIGSLGDLHPYIALALEMRKRYVEPVIATSNIYRERIESLNLLRFLGKGPTPIVFTLGSAAVHIAGDFYRESIKAAKLLNRRAVLLIGGERNRPAEPLPEGIIAVNYAPFGEILPRAAAMVHQCGVGTTAQGLRAGIPML